MIAFGPESFVVVMTKTEPKKTIREFVYQRVREGKCIYHDDGPIKSATSGSWCNRDAKKMGVCEKHYGTYRSLIVNRPAQEVAQIESKLIGDGLLLGRQTVREIKRNNAMINRAREVQGKVS